MSKTDNTKRAGRGGYKRLGELLIAAGMITQDDLEQGIALQKGTNKRLGTILLEHGIITEDQLIEALRMQLGIEFVDLTRVNIPVELAQILPKNIARQYKVVPVRMVRDELFLAMEDPLNFYAIEEVRKATHKRVVPMVATSTSIERSIQVLYGNEGAARAIEEMRREAAEKADTTEAVEAAFATALPPSGLSTQLSSAQSTSARVISTWNPARRRCRSACVLTASCAISSPFPESFRHPLFPVSRS